MSNIRRPKHGSMQYWPRKRAKRSYARIRNWPKVDGIKLLAFIGYKAGMTHIMARDNTINSLTKDMTISVPVTVIECPPIHPFSIRFYKKNINSQLQIVSEIFNKNLNKELKRKIKLPKKQNQEPKEYDDIKIVLYSNPKLIGIKKKPDILEVGLSGTKEEKLILAKKLLEQKEIKLEEVFQKNQMLDISGITKGKGFQGTVKRYGVPILQHKAEKKKRGIATSGPWTPKKISYRVPRAGRMGNHQRKEYNKQILKISQDPKEINVKGGFLRYGLVKNPYILVKGSIPGPAKRTIVMTYPRGQAKTQNLEIVKISTSSKQ